MSLVTYALQGARARSLYWDVIRDPDIVMFHVLNETNGTTAYDRCTRNIIDGTLVNTPTQGAALGNGFNGMTFSAASSEYITLGTPSALAFLDAGACSVVAVCSVNNTAAVKSIIGRRSSAGNTPGWEFRFAADETLEYSLVDDSAGADTVGSDAALTTGTQLMVGFSKSGAGAAAVTLYSAGIAVADTDDANAAAGDPTYTSIAACIGARNATDQFFDGSIGMIAVFNAAKTANDFKRWAYLASLL